MTLTQEVICEKLSLRRAPLGTRFKKCISELISLPRVPKIEPRNTWAPGGFLSMEVSWDNNSIWILICPWKVVESVSFLQEVFTISEYEGNRTRKQDQGRFSVVTTDARQLDLAVITCETSLFENFQKYPWCTVSERTDITVHIQVDY